MSRHTSTYLRSPISLFESCSCSGWWPASVCNLPPPSLPSSASSRSWPPDLLVLDVEKDWELYGGQTQHTDGLINTRYIQFRFLYVIDNGINIDMKSILIYCFILETLPQHLNINVKYVKYYNILESSRGSCSYDI